MIRKKGINGRNMQLEREATNDWQTTTQNPNRMLLRRTTTEEIECCSVPRAPCDTNRFVDLFRCSSPLTNFVCSAISIAFAIALLTFISISWIISCRLLLLLPFNRQTNMDWAHRWAQSAAHSAVQRFRWTHFSIGFLFVFIYLCCVASWPARARGTTRLPAMLIDCAPANDTRTAKYIFYNLLLTRDSRPYTAKRDKWIKCAHQIDHKIRGVGISPPLSCCAVLWYGVVLSALDETINR